MRGGKRTGLPKRLFARRIAQFWTPPVFFDDSNRARDAAERSLEEVDEAADRPAWPPKFPPYLRLSVGLSHSVHRSRQAEASSAWESVARSAKVSRGARSVRRDHGALSRARPGPGSTGVVRIFSGTSAGRPAHSRMRFDASRPGKAFTTVWAGVDSPGRYHLAEEAFRSALERNPDYVDALNGLGSALFARAQYEAALRPLEKALQESQRLVSAEPPELTPLRGKMAWSLYYLERYREALAMFIRASLAVPMPTLTKSEWDGVTSSSAKRTTRERHFNGR